MRNQKLVITTEPKTFCFDLPKDAGNSLKISSMIKYNELSAEHTIKNEIRGLLGKYNYRNNIHDQRKQYSKRTAKIRFKLITKIKLKKLE